MKAQPMKLKTEPPALQATLFLRPAFSITALAGGLGVRVTVKHAG